MRRIVVESARRKRCLKRGAEQARRDLDEAIAAPEPVGDLLALDESLAKLANLDPKVAQLVELRYFAGLTIREAAEVLGISSRTANIYWAYAKAWLLKELESGEP